LFWLLSTIERLLIFMGVSGCFWPSAHTCDLATGPRDIVIVLERPASDHHYILEFREFIEKSLALNELILFAMKLSRSIFTVSVIDAFSFQPKSKVPPQPSYQPLDSECLTLLGEFLRLKQPRIVLSCTCVVQ
jgi:hypothetical protein